MSNGNSQRKTKRWIRANVYRIRLFRIFREEAEKTRDPGERKRLEQKIRHHQKKIDFLAERGKAMGLTDERIITINREIVERIIKRERPKTIIRILEEKNLK